MQKFYGKRNRTRKNSQGISSRKPEKVEQNKRKTKILRRKPINYGNEKIEYVTLGRKYNEE